MQLHVIHAEALTPSIRLLRLARTDHEPLPAFQPGAHVEVQVPLGDTTAVRKYSLVSDGEVRSHCEIAVKRSPDGRGGSRFLHDVLAVGDTLEVSLPIHDFDIAPQGRHHVLVAGGIGITPMLGIVSSLERSGGSYELHYTGRSATDMAFRDHLLRHHAARTHLYVTRGEHARRLDVDALLARHGDQADTHLYVCGPGSLIDAVRLGGEARGIGRRRIHFESFGPAWTPSDRPVRLVLSASGIELDVAPGTTLLDAMEAAGAWVPSDCKRGECGACIASYSGGRPLHRDNCLTEAQRDHAMCPCVSWASPDEVLTLQL